MSRGRCNTRGGWGGQDSAGQRRGEAWAVEASLVPVSSLGHWVGGRQEREGGAEMLASPLSLHPPPPPFRKTPGFLRPDLAFVCSHWRFQSQGSWLKSRFAARVGGWPSSVSALANGVIVAE